ncbi:HIT family protein [archaeon D22]|nr:HIT family protein [archaeon D22]
MEGCLFCKLKNGEIPSKKVHEDENVVAFLDISPVAKGHTLVIPKNHSADITDMNEDEITNVFRVAKKIGQKMIETLGAEGFNINMNNKPASGQVIFHSHVHVIPRFSDDGLKLWPGKQKYEEGEADKILEKLVF